MQKPKWAYPKLLSKPDRKSYSVRVLKGFVSENPGVVKSKRCLRCPNKPGLVAVNFGDPGVRLYGCNREKCKDILIKIIMNELLPS